MMTRVAAGCLLKVINVLVMSQSYQCVIMSMCKLSNKAGNMSATAQNKSGQEIFHATEVLNHTGQLNIISMSTVSRLRLD